MINIARNSMIDKHRLAIKSCWSVPAIGLGLARIKLSNIRRDAWHWTTSKSASCDYWWLMLGRCKLISDARSLRKLLTRLGLISLTCWKVLIIRIIWQGSSATRKVWLDMRLRKRRLNVSKSCSGPINSHRARSLNHICLPDDRLVHVTCNLLVTCRSTSMLTWSIDSASRNLRVASSELCLLIRPDLTVHLVLLGLT